MHRNCLSASLLVATTLVFSYDALASDWQWAGGVVITHQQTDAPEVASETAASADLVLIKQQVSGRWLMHVEAASSPKFMGVSNQLPEANSDAGSAISKNDQGRFQLSELYYQHQFSAQQTLSAGLLDVSSFFEQSRIASDEATQFLGAFFTGNPVLAFPDYTLGVVYEQQFNGGPTLRTAITSSNGLADNPARSYSQVLAVTEEEKGLFAISSLSWRNASSLIRIGVWRSTADFSRLDDANAVADNYGVYVLAGYQYGQHAWNLRLGAANEDVSQAAAFSGLSYQFSQGHYVLGVGMARTYQAKVSKAENTADTQQYEIYVRYTLADGFYLTADWQGIVNSNFTPDTARRNQLDQVYGVRFSWVFG
ncbi:carbohydrate porin [Alishewanella sp. 16-MA]|uniref:Carbohydrate porin n=1 Tax=Alishewanella maricola TaxID=2795740 RepID=A0ABS8C305_9ALTE|nr:carbohydrate porin [Alishewanella maricola]MCB5226686.1 carbohydrate porin [Alishewanella maricola]